MNNVIKFLAFLLSFHSLFSQESSTANDHSLLWKIEGKELANPSFLFGTIHMIPKEDYFLPDGMEEALQQCRKIFFEIDLDKLNDPSSLFGLMENIFMKNDTSLSDLVSKEEYDKLNAYFENLGFPLVMFERMKPMFLSALAGVDANPMALQDGSFKSYELELAELAKKNKLEVDGLETIEFQLSIFDSIPYSIQAKMLLESVSASTDNTEEVKQMYKNYKLQNLEALNKTISNENQQLKPYLDMILYNRNKNWIPIMRSEMSKGNCFFAVGAGHLSGKQGVISLLRNEGYTLSPLTR